MTKGERHQAFLDRKREKEELERQFPGASLSHHTNRGELDVTLSLEAVFAPRTGIYGRFINLGPLEVR